LHEALFQVVVWYKWKDKPFEHWGNKWNYLLLFSGCGGQVFSDARLASIISVVIRSVLMFDVA
jgi:hypothetical protein